MALYRPSYIYTKIKQLIYIDLKAEIMTFRKKMINQYDQINCMLIFKYNVICRCVMVMSYGSISIMITVKLPSQMTLGHWQKDLAGRGFSIPTSYNLGLVIAVYLCHCCSHLNKIYSVFLFVLALRRTDAKAYGSNAVTFWHRHRYSGETL